MPSIHELAVGTQHCGVCGARPTQVCVVTRGRAMGSPAEHPHRARVEPLETARRLGEGEGRRAHSLAVRRRGMAEGIDPGLLDRVAQL